MHVEIAEAIREVRGHGYQLGMESLKFRAGQSCNSKLQ